jgi:mannose-6-phosphate isomerase-like protein (cupin superfamily)
VQEYVMEISTHAVVIREREAASFMEGDEFCRRYVSTGKVTFGTSTLQPGQRGAVDLGHAVSHEVFFCIRGHILIRLQDQDYVELFEGDAVVIPEGLPHTLVNVGDTPAFVSWSLGPTP